MPSRIVEAFQLIPKELMSGAKIPYLYITGVSRCGSTLLAFLLNAHPYMASVSQAGGPIPSVNLERYPCSCGAVFLRCPFFLELERRVNALGSSFTLRDWQTLFRLSRHRWLNILLVRPLRHVGLEGLRDRLVPFWPGYGQAIGTISRRIVHVAQATLTISGKEVFVDAQKDPIRVKFLQDIAQLDLKVIHLVRDVRGTVTSYMKTFKGMNAARATRIWYIANANAERARRHVATHQWLRIRYDELCSDPQATIDRISNFVGVEQSVIPKDFYEGEHHIIGNRMRLRGKGSGIVRQDDSWKDYLTERDLGIIARIGGAANRSYGHNWP
jgi:Sulfotransferase family